MIKKIVLFGLLFISLPVAYANEVFTYNCNLDEDSLTPRIQNLIATNEILDEEAVSIALSNLDIYCRSQKLKTPFLGGGQDVPESPYLYDQLSDVAFRKLFGDSQGAYGLTVDEKGQQRREGIRKLAESGEGNPSQKYLELYANIWQPKTVKGLEYKYKSVCAEIYSVGMLFLQNFDKDKSSQFRYVCDYKANQIIRKEMTYLKVIMMGRSIKYMKDNINNYASKYFVKTRMDKLIEKFSVLDGYFSVVTSKVSEGTKNCNY